MIILYCLMLFVVNLSEAVPDIGTIENQKPNLDIVTQTVYGFLDFTTTIGNTVMVFSPKSSSPAEISNSITEISNSITEMKPILINTQIQNINPSKTIKETSEYKPIMTTPLEIVQSSKSVISISSISKPTKLLSKVQIITSFKHLNNTENEKDETIFNGNDNDHIVPVGNILDEPEYDFLSRQPSEFVEETFKVMNLKSNVNTQSRIKSSVNLNNKKSENVKVKSNFPTGLVTKVGGTIVKDGATTVHETSVIGTYISGKYAQVLQSSSHIFKYNKQKISSTPTLKVLKTSPPTNNLLNNRHRAELKSDDYDRLKSDDHNKFTSTRRHSSIGNLKKGIRNQSKEDDNVRKIENIPTSIEPSANKVPKRVKPKSRRNKNSRSVVNNNNKASTSIISLPNESTTRRNFKPKHQHSTSDNLQGEQTSLYKFKLNRTPGRWQYKSSVKPRITIRKTFNPGEDQSKLVSVFPQNSEIITNDISKRVYNSTSEESDLESSGSISGAVFNDVESGNGKVIADLDRKYPIETLNVEISTAADLKDKYFEIATIKTPYLFQVGTGKRTRYITVTSTFEKTFEPEPTSTLQPNEPLTENILVSTSQIGREQNILEPSIVTLPPIYLSSDEETPPIETKVESFSTTQIILKTNILPVIRNQSTTSSITLIQTYRITRFVTATKTLPPLEAYEFVPSQHLKEFNSKLDEAGSELNIELEFGDENGNIEDNSDSRQILPNPDIMEISSELDIINSKNKKIVSPSIAHVVPEVNRNQVVGDQLQQLALLGLLNPAQEQFKNFGQTPKPLYKLETVYKTEIIPILKGHSTSFSTITRPITTVQKTEYDQFTNYSPLQIPQPFGQQFGQQYHLTTAPIISQTVITETLSKVLKLTFGAKTAYTTLFSTNVIPTMLTTYITTSVQVHPTAALPGYYPGPFAPYPFLG